MFGNNDTRHIDLHLPQSWNHCTTDELEAIAAAIIQEQQRVDRYHPFDWQRVKLAVLLSINEITVKRWNEGTTGGDSRNNDYPINRLTEEGNAAAADDEWLVQRPQDKEPWPISVGQLLALTDMLSWIDDEKADKTVFLFPYPELNVGGRTADHPLGGRTADHPWGGKTAHHRVHGGSPAMILVGPPPLLDGYTWREYRLLTDWMQEYMRFANALAQSKREDVKRKNQAAIDTAQREFLAVLFKPAKAAGEPTDGLGGRTAEHTVPSDSFAGFSPVQWQVILFWWSSLMAMLAKKFPRVFKSQPVGKGRRGTQQKDNPWDFYNRVTATIQKYIGGLSEQDVNSATYGTVLQQLEMMADEAAELERAKSRHP